MTLYDKLSELNTSDMYPLHMPGHKRNFSFSEMQKFYGIDITEIDDFDDLHEANGIIREIEIKASNLYGAGEAFISVNGSTAANEAAILYGLRNSKEIIVARNSHKSVYYAMELSDAKPIFVTPDIINNSIYGCVNATQIEEQMKAHPQCKTVVITSPTYEGIIADIGEISKTVHLNGGILIVDCAHGAHFGLADVFPENPITLGADIVIISLHKMLPSPTQTAMLLISKEAIELNRVSPEGIKHYMRIFQSSSPSYILMAGIGETINYIEKQIDEDADILISRIIKLHKDISSLNNICIEISSQTEIKKDICKLIIGTRKNRIKGRTIYNLLRNDYHIQCEMCGTDYALGLLTVSDTEEGFNRITYALTDMDKRIENGEIPFDLSEKREELEYLSINGLEFAYGISKALSSHSKMAKLDDTCIGKVSAEYVCAYPPGMPILIPGEKINEEVLQYIKNALLLGINIQGLQEGMLKVISE